MLLWPVNSWGTRVVWHLRTGKTGQSICPPPMSNVVPLLCPMWSPSYVQCGPPPMSNVVPPPMPHLHTCTMCVHVCVYVCTCVCVDVCVFVVMCVCFTDSNIMNSYFSGCGILMYFNSPLASPVAYLRRHLCTAYLQGATHQAHARILPTTMPGSSAVATAVSARVGGGRRVMEGFLSLADNSGTVRLSGGSRASAGRVEVLYNGVWGTVCSYFTPWTLTDGQVVCAQLGYKNLSTVSISPTIR